MGGTTASADGFVDVSRLQVWAAPIICTVVVPVAGHEAFVLPSSAVEVWAGNGARGRGMRYLFVAYGLELFVFVGAPTLAWFVFFG